MPRRAVVVILLLLVIGGGLAIVLIQKARLNNHIAASRNNLRELSLFAAYHAKPDPRRDTKGWLAEIPAGTVVLPGVEPAERLSWLVPALPGLNQTRQDFATLIAQIDTTQPWAAERNQTAAKTRLLVVLCPENLPEVAPGSPAVTCYVGIAGLGSDAATLALSPTGGPPRAGAFRYDAPTPFTRVSDGLSQTLMIGETAAAPGAWLRGGFSTVRGLDDAANAKPLIGVGGQFGGFFPMGAHFAFCDGSVRLFTPHTTPDVLKSLATIAGGAEQIGVLE